ncbi:unnamed protein product [Lymnaea stagnalis]|uniref:Uncharacterized protein n=1 Tax=Lymnaea stagnalis TaxID=6523 RepID=A0AAV2GX03_LYMST
MKSLRLVCFIFMISLYLLITHGTQESTTPPPDHLVLISAPVNVTFYYVNSTSITVTWDPPQVYTSHDVDNVDDIDFTNDTDEQPQPTDPADSSSSAPGSDAHPLNNEVAPSSTTSDVPTTTIKTEPARKCQPYMHFLAYAVQLKKVRDSSTGTMAIPLGDSGIEDKQPEANSTEPSAVVPFEEGCIVSYRVKWLEVNTTKSEQRNVFPSEHTALIFNLKPRTNYSITVTAVFVRKEFESQPPLFVVTTNETSKVCQCDWHGTTTPIACGQDGGTDHCHCKPGYEGQFCEKCSAGFYRTLNHFPCHRCPCEVHATTTNTCSFIEGFLSCDGCKVGYSGNLCHTCDQGFYRYGRHCVPCRCNGNAHSNDVNMCSKHTGACTKCLYNTTGFNCERCLHGYVGDAIGAKNCTRTEDLNGLFFVKGSNSSSTKVVGSVIGVTVLVMLAVFGFFLYRKYRAQERRRAFWTIEMKRDDNDGDFNSVHNDEAQLDEPDVRIYGKKSGKPDSSKYSKLHEEM